MNNRPTLPQIILGFLGLYKEYRTQNNNSFVDGTKYYYESALSVFTGTKPVDTQLNQMLSEIELQAETANDFDDFYALIIILREKAELAQTLKYAKNESKLHGTLHALASIIINEYKNTELFKLKIEQLKSQVQEHETQITNLTKTKNGVGVTDIRQKRNAIILELAYLEEDEYILKALDHGSLKSLTVPTIESLANIGYKLPVNYASPIHLQANYAKGFYASTFQTFKNIGFEEFINGCTQIKINKVQQSSNSNSQIEQQLLQQMKLQQELQPQQQQLLQQQEQQQLAALQSETSTQSNDLKLTLVQESQPLVPEILQTMQTLNVETVERQPSSQGKSNIQYPEKVTSSEAGLFNNSKVTPILPAHTVANANGTNRTKNKK